MVKGRQGRARRARGALVALCVAWWGLCLGCAEPARGEERTLPRQSAGEVVIDERFFEPFFLASDAPKQLREAYTSFAAGKGGEARQKLLAFVEANPKHEHVERARLLLAWLEREAGDHKAAAARFEEVSQGYPLLADHARYWGAQEAFAAEDYERAVRLCQGVGMGSSFGPRSKYLRGRALLRLGKHDEAIKVLEDFLEQFGGASYKGDVKLSLAVAYEKQGKVEQAAKLFHALRVAYPGKSLEKEAEDGIARLQKRLSADQKAKLLAWTPKDRVKRAEALYEVHRSEQVIEEMDKLLGSKTLQEGEGVWCAATFLRAQAARKLRKHKDAGQFYGRFLDGCQRSEETVQALFSGARSLWTANEDEQAQAWFGRIWDEYASHSYADDAVLYAARIRLENDDPQEAHKLLRFLIENFPRGDMQADAHWLLFHDFYAEGDWEQAVEFADDIEGRTGEATLYDRGRVAYFRARALEQLSRKGEAAKGYEQVLVQAPMSYYALLALNRLKVLDEDRYDDALARVVDGSHARARWTLEPPQLAQDGAFRRGVELLRLGLFTEARGEFDQLEERYPSDEKLLWVLTLLYDRAGAYPLSHDIPRRQIGSFGTTWPVGQDRAMYELAYPRPFHAEVARWAKERGLPEALVYAIMREESGFNARIESWANAYGLMQLILPTARDMAKADNLTNPKPDKLQGSHLFDPSTNIRLGTRFLDELSASYHDNPVLTISGYNGGFGNVDRWLKERGSTPLDLWVEQIPYGQTQGYTKRVLMTMWIYQWLYGDEDDRVIPISLKLPGPSQ